MSFIYNIKTLSLSSNELLNIWIHLNWLGCSETLIILSLVVLYGVAVTMEISLFDLMNLYFDSEEPFQIFVVSILHNCKLMITIVIL